MSRLLVFILIVAAYGPTTGCGASRDDASTGDAIEGTMTDVGREPDAALEPAVACSRLDASFEPCGGDLIGTWAIELYCPLARAWDPLDGTCADLVADGEGEAVGELLVFDNGAYLLEYDERRLQLRFGFPLACYGGSSVPCNGAFYNGQCELATSTECACEVDIDYRDESEVGVLEYFGSSVVFDIDGLRQSGAYCVNGDELTLMRFSVGESLGFRMRLRRR